MLFHAIKENTHEGKEKKRWTDALMDAGYSSGGAKSAAEKILVMDEEIREGLSRWMEEGELVDIAIEDISVHELVNELGYKEIAAFLMLDWLRREPDAAKEAICRFADRVVISKECLKKLKIVAEEDDAANAEEKARIEAEEAAENEDESHEV